MKSLFPSNWSPVDVVNVWRLEENRRRNWGEYLWHRHGVVPTGKNGRWMVMMHLCPELFPRPGIAKKYSKDYFKDDVLAGIRSAHRCQLLMRPDGQWIDVAVKRQRDEPPIAKLERMFPGCAARRKK